MNMPVMDGHDDADNFKDGKSHPENARRCKPCEEGSCDNCRIKYTGGLKCRCECRDPLRTKKHDWLDSQFNDEIDLEKAMGDAPPIQLVINASIRGAVTPTALDVAWFFLGKFKTTTARPSTSDAKWTLTCKRCKSATKIKTSRIVVEAQNAYDVTWLRERKIHVDAISQRIYRVGRCLKCSGVFWFELLLPSEGITK